MYLSLDAAGIGDDRADSSNLCSAIGGAEMIYPLTLPELAMPSTRYSSPCRKSSRDGIIYTVAIANARPISPALIWERKTESGCESASCRRMRGCSTMFQ